MQIKYLGHSCFLLTSNQGVRVLTDPFNEKVGYRLPEESADIVTTSHNHYDHGYTGAVKGDFHTINTPGSHHVKGMEITGVSTFHDEAGGSKRGKNVIFKFDMDGIKVCHCGDLGHLLNEGQVKEVGEVDVLLVPVGGVYTVDAEGARQVVKQLKSRVTIPMHYKTKALSFDLESVDAFLGLMGDYRILGSNALEVNKTGLENFGDVIVMEYE